MRKLPKIFRILSILGLNYYLRGGGALKIILVKCSKILGRGVWKIWEVQKKLYVRLVVCWVKKFLLYLYEKGTFGYIVKKYGVYRYWIGKMYRR